MQAEKVKSGAEAVALVSRLREENRLLRQKIRHLERIIEIIAEAIPPERN